MTEVVDTDELVELMVEVRSEGEHGPASSSSTYRVLDTQANIDLLVARIEASGTWAVSMRSETKSAADTWAEIHQWDDDAYDFDEAPRTREEWKADNE